MSKDFHTSHILPYVGIIVKICRAYTFTQEDFEDYYQEVCLQVWKSRNNFKEKSEWSTWVYRVALNVCLTLTKKKKVQTEHLDMHAINATEPGAQFENENNELARLYQAIRQLSEIDRAVVLLYLEEKSYQEIAHIMGASPTNIGVRINRIKKRLKKIINGKYN